MRGVVLPAVCSPNARGSLAFCPAMISPAPITSQSALHLGLAGGIDNVAFKAEPGQPHSFGAGGQQNSQLSSRKNYFISYITQRCGMIWGLSGQANPEMGAVLYGGWRWHRVLTL